MALDPDTQTPSIADLAEGLRKRVGTLPAGSRVPTVRQVMKEYGVSQYLVQEAMAQLRKEGVISSHVGRGTFVGRTPVATQRQRNVLTLLYQHPYERGDRIARLIHQRLARDGHRSLVLTYSDVAQVMDMLRSGTRFDASILQPRGSTVPVALLALLRQRSDCVLIESQAAEHLDVDAVSNDPFQATALIVGHLRGLGHRRIAWLTELGGNYFFERAATCFEAFRAGAGLAEGDWPLLRAPTSEQRLGLADATASLRALLPHRAADQATAVVVASFSEGQTILDAFAALGLQVPRDVSVVKIGTPDVEPDHVNRLTIIGRSSAQAAETVIRRIYWRWDNPEAPFETLYDPPVITEFGSTAVLQG